MLIDTQFIDGVARKEVRAGCGISYRKLGGPNLDFGEGPTTLQYTEASASWPNAIRPYPNPEDICQELRENSDIRDPVSDGSFLIACPKHERGAIAVRRKEGAQPIFRTSTLSWGDFADF